MRTGNVSIGIFSSQQMGWGVRGVMYCWAVDLGNAGVSVCSCHSVITSVFLAGLPQVLTLAQIPSLINKSCCISHSCSGSRKDTENGKWNKTFLRLLSRTWLVPTVTVSSIYSICFRNVVLSDSVVAPAFHRTPEQTGWIQSGHVDGSMWASSISTRLFTRSQTSVGNQKWHPGVLDLLGSPLTCRCSCTAALKSSLLQLKWYYWNLTEGVSSWFKPQKWKSSDDVRH